MLELKNLNKIYQVKDDDIDVAEVHAVKDISLTFERGEFVSILGLSGSGKTTLVSMIGGLEESTSGELIIDDIGTSTFNQHQWTDYRKNTIGFVFQDFNLIDHLSAIDNIKIALSLSGHDEVEKEKRAVELLRLVNMSDHRGHFPKELSGGQQQRIAIARALANNPEVILADEPTGALDPDTSVQIMNLLQSLADKGHLVIMVTHNKYIARDYSTRIVELKDGKVINDDILRETSKITKEKVQLQKSLLQLSSAFKIALNNLKKRKKSSLIALFSLIPSIILVMLFGNFIINMMTYQEDLQPIYQSIVNEDNVSYMAPRSEGAFELDIKSVIAGLDGGKYDGMRVGKAEDRLYEPYTDEQIAEMEAMENIEKVFKPMYMNVTINEQYFILVGLLPEAYKQYQYDMNFGYYPDDADQGLIMSDSTMKAILGNDANVATLEGKNIDLKVGSYNGIPLHAQVYHDKRHELTLPVLKVFEPKSKTVLMNNYYTGYIFVPYEYMQSLMADYTRKDISIVSYGIADVWSPDAINGMYYFDGAQYLSDLLAPVRSQRGGEDALNVFTFKEYPIQIPSNNFMMRHMLITNGELSEEEQNALGHFGVFYRSKFDEYAVDSAYETNDFIEKLLLYSKIAVGIIIALPSILVTLILYISILLRNKEIGVLKSIGARKKDIVTIFTLESGILAGVSSAVAILLSAPILLYAKQILEEQYDISFKLGSNPLEINILAIIGSLLAVTLLTTILGLLPGRKASKLHPRDLLRSIN